MLLYITASGGIVLNISYCMGKVSSVAIYNYDKNEACKKCGMAESAPNCCSSEFKLVKVNNVHKATIAVNNIQPAVTNLPVNISLIDISKLSSNNTGVVVYVPPIDVSPDLNVLNCTLRI